VAEQLPEVIATDPAQARTEASTGGAPAHAEPELFGMEPFQIVALAMMVLILIMLWKRVPGMVTRGIDGKIAAIKQQLDEAKALRAEAEELRTEYAAKIAGAEKDAEAMLANAQTEADDILAKAEADGKAMVARRERMATDKIAAAEREALESVRNKAVAAATAASRKLIAEKHGEDADRALADKVIAGL
jgi:F-type H+-transporting ATPase subunit b